MKKVLSLMMMLMLALGAWAATIDLAYPGGTTTNMTGGNDAALVGLDATAWSVVGAKGAHNNFPGLNQAGDIRLYWIAEGGNTLTVSSLNGATINSITFEFTGANYSNIYVKVDGETVTANEGVYAIDASSFVVGNANTSNVQVRIKKITIDYTGGTAPAVAAPVIEGETPFTESTLVTMSCATEGATIYYTLNGTEPTNQSTAYSSTFMLTTTTTVKAIAYDANNNASSVATKEFVKEEPVVLTNVATVAEFNALADGTDFIFTGNLVATGQTGKYLYAQDSDNGILIYGTIDQTYSDLAEIPGGWTGKKTTFNGAPEAAEPAGLAAATEHVDLAPEEMTPAQVTLENAFKYVVIRGATVTMTSSNNGTITVGDETVALYKRFNITIPTDGGVYDIIGITGYYNNPQFMPLEFVAQGVEVATPVISGETPFIGSTTVTITCETEGASIHYTIDGTDPTINSTEYTAPFELTESATVKAIAFNEAEDCSAIASKEFVKIATVATVAEYQALAEGTNFIFNGTLVVSGQKGKYLYAQDETGGVLLYGNAPAFTKGDVIPTGFSATKTIYNGTVEMTNFTLTAATETAEIVAEEVVPAQWDEDGINIYAVIKGATIDGSNLVVGDNSVVSYNRFGVTAPTDTEKAYDVYGVTSWYNNAPQFYPLEYVEAVVENTITFEAEQEGGTIAVALADGTPVESGVTKVAAGDKVTITATPAEGYKLSDIVVKCGDEEIEFDADETSGRAAETHTFTMPEGEVSIEATFEEETPTGIEGISMENVKSVRYYNAAGVESATPFQGVNIVVRVMNDGSKSVIKVVK